MDGNTITIVGNLTRDPELISVTSKRTGESIPKASFSIARSWYTGEGDARTQRAEYFDCEVWREQAVNLAESLAKGTRIIVHGTLRQDSWMVDVPGSNEPVRRTKTRIEVIDAGPALRFAKADVHKNPRPDAGEPVAVAVAASNEDSEVEFAEEAPF